ncbi:MAG: hypothetical protein K5654_03195 [Lachnospiraceae bacterium]|jgi:hypothetical protein|nr:hypothetical protein [Lachnospiraceae bacterium]
METQTLEFKGLKRRVTPTTTTKGNTAVKLNPKKNKKNMLEVLPKEIKKYNISSRLLLTVFYVVCIGLFIGSILVYINLQGDLSNSSDKIASLKTRYEQEKKDNDAELAAINNSIDNEEIRRVAIEKLGMHYASDGQVVEYTEDYVNDYVRVYSVIH